MSSTPPPRTEIDDISSTKRLPSSPEAAKSESKRVKTDMTDATTTIVDAASNMATKTTTTSPITNPSGLAALQIKKLSPAAKTPTRGSEFAAGYDMYAVRATTIPARGKALVDTDIAMAVPAGTYGRIAPRSGLAAKNFIDTGAGVIDADYRGQVKILLFNHADSDFKVNEGDRVAQLILERIYTPDVIVVEELDESVRGAGGFGSTGN